MTPFYKTLVIIAPLSLMLSSGAKASEGDVINVNASFSSLRDSNLFRLAPSADPRALGLRSKADTVFSSEVALAFDKSLSLQRFVGDITLVDTRYRNNDYLNFLALNYDAKWLWAAGLRWSGDLSVEHTERLNSFTDFNNFNARNVRSIDSERFNASYWFHSNWAALAGISHHKVTNEQPFLADTDYEGRGYNVGLRYRPRSGNTLIVRAKEMNGTYSNRQFNSVSQYDNGFRQRGLEFNVDWQLTGKSLVRSNIERMQRRHDHFSSRDYAGWIGTVDYLYAYSGKGSLALGYKHGLEAYQQALSSYYVLDEFSVAAQWQATSKLSAAVRTGVGHRSYRGEIAPLPAGLGQREDRFTRLGVDLNFRPARWIEFKAGLGLENRNVNNDAFDYRDRTGFVSATAHF